MYIFELVKKIPLIGCFLSLSFSIFAFDYELGGKILVLSPTDDNPNLELISNGLRGHQIPFEVLVLTKRRKRIFKRKSLPLFDRSGNGKYYGVVLTSPDLLYKKTFGRTKSALDPERWQELHNYLNKYNVRKVVLSSSPYNVPGANALGEGRTSLVKLKINSQFKINALGLKTNNSFMLKDAWHTPAKLITKSTLAVIGSSQNALAATAIIDRREEMHFFFEMAPEQKASWALANLWINWLTKGQYLGKRRIHLNVHVDDHFLSTDLHPSRSHKKYRINERDMDLFVYHRKKEIAKLTKNPDYRIEMAFNGQGIFLHGPAHSGHFTPNLMNGERLYDNSLKNLSEFYWVNHTFTHQDLNRINYQDAYKELLDNKKVAEIMFDGKFKNGKFVANGNKGLEKYFSPHSMVTPHISGLFNKDALKAIKDSSIYSVVGDNSVKELKPEHPHQAYYTTRRKNNFAGILVMPRYATDIYYNCSLPSELVDLYNDVNGGLRKKFSFESLYQVEVDRTVPFLLNYQMAPYMFHQGNLRGFDYKGSQESLISLWIKKVLKDLRSYTDLPVISMKMDDLAREYKNQHNEEKCKEGVKFQFTDGKISAIKRDQNISPKNCRLSFTGNLVKGANQTEHYGPDRTSTLYFDSNNKVYDL